MNIEVNLNVSVSKKMEKKKSATSTIREIREPIDSIPIISSPSVSKGSTSKFPNNHPPPASSSISDSLGHSRMQNSILDLEKDDFYKNLQNVREKIQRLGTLREDTRENIKQIRSATDRYTELLSSGRPIREDSLAEMSIVSSTPALDVSENFLNDDEIRSRLESIQRKFHQMENHLDRSSRVLVDRMTSAYGNEGLITSLLDKHSKLSDVEKGRSIFIEPLNFDADDNPKGRATAQPIACSSPSIRPVSSAMSESPIHSGRIIGRGSADFLGDGARINDSNGRDSPRSVSTSGSSLRPLNESQRAKLQQLQDGLRREAITTTATAAKTTASEKQKPQSAPSQHHSSASNRLQSFAPAPQLRFESSAAVAIYCDRCGLSKDRRCVCSVVEKRSQQTSIGQLLNDGGELGAPPKQSEDEKSKILEARGTQTDRDARLENERTKKVDVSCQAATDEKPALSAETSPARKIPRKSTPAVVQRPAPFVTGKSVGQSHSVLVNWQQLLAVLKTQNPTLHEFCLRLQPNEAMSAEFLETFRQEVAQLLRTWKQELRELSRDFAAVMQSNTMPDSKRNREIAKQANRIAAQMEAKDTAIQRIQRQLDAVVAAISSKHGRRTCKKTRNSQPRHTATRSKSTSKSSSLDKALLRRRQTSALMRDTKALVTAVING